MEEKARNTTLLYNSLFQSLSSLISLCDSIFFGHLTIFDVSVALTAIILKLATPPQLSVNFPNFWTDDHGTLIASLLWSADSHSEVSYFTKNWRPLLLCIVTTHNIYQHVSKVRPHFSHHFQRKKPLVLYSGQYDSFYQLNLILNVLNSYVFGFFLQDLMKASDVELDEMFKLSFAYDIVNVSKFISPASVME